MDWTLLTIQPDYCISQELSGLHWFHIPNGIFTHDAFWKFSCVICAATELTILKLPEEGGSWNVVVEIYFCSLVNLSVWVTSFLDILFLCDSLYPLGSRFLPWLAVVFLWSFIFKYTIFGITNLYPPWIRHSSQKQPPCQEQIYILDMRCSSRRKSVSANLQ